MKHNLFTFAQTLNRHPILLMDEYMDKQSTHSIHNPHKTYFAHKPNLSAEG